MNEYEYYEFYATTHPLTSKDIAELRRISSKAEITPHQFINAYSWERFPGDENHWLEKYFDFLLYYTNRGHHKYKIKISSDILDPKIAATYCIGSNASLCLFNDKMIIGFSAHSHARECTWQLSPLLKVYEDLAKGDYRCLYLGWLANIQNLQDFDDSLEPFVPAGLNELTEPLQYFVNFLNLDQDLVTVAASSSLPLVKNDCQDNSYMDWVKHLTVEEKDQVLIDLVKGGCNGNYSAAIDFVRRYKLTRSHQLQQAVALRTVAQLKYRAQQITSERERLIKEKADLKLAEETRVLKLIKQQRFSELLGNEILVWSKVESLIEARQATDYDTAIQLLKLLKDFGKNDVSSSFFIKYNELKIRHMRKASFIAKLSQFEKSFGP